VADTQYYVRDAVIDYTTYKGTISPAIEGRLKFITDATAPTITITSPTATTYLHPTKFMVDFDVVDVGPAGLKSVIADIDGVPVTDGQQIDTLTLALGDHTFTIRAVDKAYNESSASVTFKVSATVQSLKDTMYRLYNEGNFSKAAIYKNLYNKLNLAQADIAKNQNRLAINHLVSFINEVRAQSGKSIKTDAANLLIADAQWVITSLQ
jgi:hypothetical protein